MAAILKLRFEAGALELAKWGSPKRLTVLINSVAIYQIQPIVNGFCSTLEQEISALERAVVANRANDGV